MSSVLLKNSILGGDITVPPSKSVSHRALICSFLANAGVVEPIIDSNDMRATQQVISAIREGREVLDCIESGSTMRFMIPVAAALGLNVTLWDKAVSCHARWVRIWIYCHSTESAWRATDICLLSYPADCKAAHLR